MKRIPVTLFVMLAGILWLGCAAAQSYPTKPVRTLYPFPAGGGGELALRALTAELGKRTSHPFLVENRPGGNTMIAADLCAKASADGYTICMVPIDAISINPFIFKKLPYDPENDLEPVASVFSNVQAFFVNPALKVGSLKEFIELAKSKPGALNYGSPAAFVMLYFEGFNSTVGIDVKHIPYKGGGDVITALLAGDIQVAFVALSNVVGLLKSGKIKVLAVEGSKRSPLAPDVPTLSEAGFQGMPFRAWYGVFAPRGTPKSIISQLHGHIAAVLETPAFREELIGRGLDPMPGTTEQFAQYLREDRVRAQKLVKQAGLQAE